jgi:hypothetical protein
MLDVPPLKVERGHQSSLRAATTANVQQGQPEVEIAIIQIHAFESA